jgi:hypothetical protein
VEQEAVGEVCLEQPVGEAKLRARSRPAGLLPQE